MGPYGESTVRPNEINANDIEGVQSRGREETEEESAKRRRFLEGSEANEKEDSEVVDKWQEQVRKERADREADGEPGIAVGADGNGSDEEQDGGDIRTMKKLIDPKLPSKSDVEMHEMTHLPFRNWCRHCVKGRGVEAAHFKSIRDEGALPEIHIDFCFPGSRVGGDALTVVVARERDSKMLLSEVVPTKGSVGKFAATRVGAFIREIGYGGAPIIIRTDQEPACTALVNDIIKCRAPAVTQVEQSPVGSSGSNDIVERGIQSFEMMARVMKDSLEYKWKVTIPDDHAVLTWMTGYASYLLNRFEVGRDGKTSYER